MRDARGQAGSSGSGGAGRDGGAGPAGGAGRGRRPSLSTSLALGALVLGAVSVASTFAFSYFQMRRLARDEALARVESVAREGLDEVRQERQELDRLARLLIERPTLNRLAREIDQPGRRGELRRFLEEFARAARLDRVVMTIPSEVVHVPRTSLVDRDPQSPESGWLFGRAGGEALQKPNAPTTSDTTSGTASDPASARVVEGIAVGRRLSLSSLVITAGAPAASAPASTRSSQLEISWVPGEEARSAVGAEGVLFGRARSAPAATWSDRDGAIAVVALSGFPGSDPAQDPAEPVSAFLRARLPRAAAEAPLRGLALRAVGSASLVGALAIGLGAFLGARLSRPLEALTREAARMGSGDLGRPIAATGTIEAVRLARSLERMRERLNTATSELESRRGEVEAILAGVADGVFAVDRGRVIRYANPPLRALTGAGENPVGRFCGDVLYPGARASERPCETSCPILHARFRGRSRALEQVGDAGRPAVVTSAAPLARDERGVESAGGLQVVILRHETGLEAARRARDEAVGNLAHELQTPLAAQLAALELLRDRVSGEGRAAVDPGIGELVLSLEAGTFRLRRLVDNLLESVRIESGELSVRSAEVDVEEIVEEAVEMTRPLLERRRQRLSVEQPVPGPRLRGDGPRLTQVLVNLLANASKFGPEGSSIGLSVSESGGWIEFRVEDEGEGFPEAGHEPTRFHRGGMRGNSPDAAAGEPPEAGSGLGLWICRSIVERHGGGLRVERLTDASGTFRTRVVAVVASGREDRAG